MIENEVSRILLNLRSLRMFSRNLTSEQLEEAYRKFSIVIEDRRKLDAVSKEQCISIAKHISDSGLDTDEIIFLLSQSSQRKRKPRPAKYHYVDAWGKHRTWTGQGRTPNAIQKAIKSGNKTLEDFSI